MSERSHWFGTPAATYAYLVPLLTHAAHKHGYALCLHGSMNFDVDLVAIPWTDSAVSPEELVLALRGAVGVADDKSKLTREYKPHRRMAWTIPLGVGLAIDLSVLMPATITPQALPSPRDFARMIRGEEISEGRASELVAERDLAIPWRMP